MRFDPPTSPRSPNRCSTFTAPTGSGVESSGYPGRLRQPAWLVHHPGRGLVPHSFPALPHEVACQAEWLGAREEPSLTELIGGVCSLAEEHYEKLLRTVVARLLGRKP